MASKDLGITTLKAVAVPLPSVPAHEGLLSDAEVELTRKVYDVLGAARAVEWMHTEIPFLQGSTPLSLMATSDGRDQVERVLGRIEHGIF